MAAVEGIRRGALLEAAHRTQPLLQVAAVARDGYQALLAEARLLVAQGTPVAIVVLRMDRFDRDRVERLRRWDELRESGIQIHAVREGGHRTDDLLKGFKALIANFEVQELSRRVTNVFELMHRPGWYHVGKPPWGYTFRPATPDERIFQSPSSVLDLAEPEAVEVVLQARGMRSRGDSLGTVTTSVLVSNGRTPRYSRRSSMIWPANRARSDAGGDAGPGLADPAGPGSAGRPAVARRVGTGVLYTAIPPCYTDDVFRTDRFDN